MLANDLKRLSVLPRSAPSTIPQGERVLGVAIRIGDNYRAHRTAHRAAAGDNSLTRTGRAHGDPANTPPTPTANKCSFPGGYPANTPPTPPTIALIPDVQQDAFFTPF